VVVLTSWDRIYHNPAAKLHQHPLFFNIIFFGDLGALAVYSKRGTGPTTPAGLRR